MLNIIPHIIWNIILFREIDLDQMHILNSKHLKIRINKQNKSMNVLEKF